MKMKLRKLMQQAGVAAIAGLFATHKFLYAKSFGTEEKEEKQDK